MIDVNLQTDLANKEERDKIRDAKDKVEDVVETVKNVVDSNNVGGIKENYVDNRFTTKGTNAIEDNEELNKLQKELKTLGQEGGITEEEAKMIVLATVKEMYEANGFSDIPDIKFEDGISGETTGARGTETGTIYIDLKKLASDMNNPDAGTVTLVGLIAHETSHSEKYGETTGNLLIEEGFADSKENLAENRFEEDKEVLTPEERAKALADLKEKYAKEKADSDSVTANSEDEFLENLTGVEEVSGLVILTTVTVYTLAMQKDPNFQEALKTGLITVKDGMVILNKAAIKSIKWGKDKLKNFAKTYGFMSKDESPKFEEGFNKDSNALTDFLKEKESFPLVNNYGYTESMDYDKPLDFKESFPSGEKQGVVIYYITKLGPQNKKVGTEWEYYVEGTILKELSKQWKVSTQEYFNVPGLKTQMGVKPDYVIHNDKGEKVAIADAKSGKEIPFDDQARGFLQVAKKTKSRTIIYYTPTGDTPIDKEFLRTADKLGIKIKQVGVK